MEYYIGYDINTFPKGETGLKVKPTDSTMSEGFSNPLLFEGTKIDLGKLPDDDKTNIEFEEQAKESAKKETNIMIIVNPSSENIIFEEGVNEGNDKVVAKCSSVEIACSFYH